jgi:hypothetical protein
VDEAQVANGVLVGLKEKLGSINGGDDGALEAIKETLLETAYEIEDRTENEEERVARGAMLAARRALAEEILTSIGRLAALHARLQKLPYVSPDADTLWGMAFEMKPIEWDGNRNDLGHFIGRHGDGGTFLGCAVDDVESAIAHVEGETHAYMFDEWAKGADAPTVVPDELKRDLKDCTLVVNDDTCAKLGVPQGTTIAALVQSRPAVRA